MGAEIPLHRCAWPSSAVTDTWVRRRGCSVEPGLVLAQQHASPPPPSQKICERKLDLKLFCLTPGRRPRREGGLREGSLITSSLKAETPNLGERRAGREPSAMGHLHKTPLQWVICTKLLCSCDLAVVNAHCAMPRSHVQIGTFLLFLALLTKYPLVSSCRTKSEVVFTFGDVNALFL